MDSVEIPIIEALEITTESIKAWTDANKVDKVAGKGLSTNDYTTEDKNKVDSIANNLVIIDGQLYLAQDQKPVSDGINFPASDIEVDADLAQPGKAADAKATGDAIAELNARIAAVASYKPITISNFKITNSASIVEKGTKIYRIDLSWKCSRTPMSLSLDGNAIDVNKTSHTYEYDEAAPITDTKTYRLQSTDERNEKASATTTISFLNGIYYGVIDMNTALDRNAILGLKYKKLTDSRVVTFTVSPGNTEHIMYALPANSKYGTPVFVVNTVPGGFYKATSIDFENESGYTEKYDIWLSDNVDLGETTIQVI